MIPALCFVQDRSLNRPRLLRCSGCFGKAGDMDGYFRTQGKIDSIDNQITSLIKERIDVCAQIAKYKKTTICRFMIRDREEET